MNTIQQPCPSCSRTLELPENATGRLAKCPACSATFTVNSSEDPPAASITPPTPPPATSRAVDPVRNPYVNAPASSHRSTNPYTVPGDMFEQRDREFVSPNIDEIVSATVSIFLARWVPLLLAALILSVASVVGLVAAGVFLQLVLMGGAQGLAVIAVLLLVPVFVFGTSYAVVAMARVGLAVARNEPSPLAKLQAPFQIAIQFLASVVFLYVVAGSIIGCFAIALMLLAQMAGGGAIFDVLMVIGIFVAIVAMIGFQIVLWPWVFVIADEKGTAITAIGRAFAIATDNKLTSALLVAASMALSVVGSLMCNVGHLVTTPVTILLFAVAYLSLTGQPVSNPNYELKQS